MCQPSRAARGTASRPARARRPSLVKLQAGPLYVPIHVTRTGIRTSPRRRDWLDSTRLLLMFCRSLRRLGQSPRRLRALVARGSDPRTCVCVCVMYCPHAVAAKRVVLTVRRTDAGRDVARLSQLASSPYRFAASGVGPPISRPLRPSVACLSASWSRTSSYGGPRSTSSSMSSSVASKCLLGQRSLSVVAAAVPTTSQRSASIARRAALTGALRGQAALTDALGLR